MQQEHMAIALEHLDDLASPHSCSPGPFSPESVPYAILVPPVDDSSHAKPAQTSKSTPCSPTNKSMEQPQPTSGNKTAESVVSDPGGWIAVRSAMVPGSSAPLIGLHGPRTK